MTKDKRDPRVDAYIAKSADFAQPILETIREAVHMALPDVTETMKWSTPFFEYQGPIAMMAAFKEHCRFGFWKGSLVTGKEGEAMDRITSVKELPPRKMLVELVKKAARLNEEGVKAPRNTTRTAKAPLKTPDDLAAALKENRKAGATFENFSPSHRREYVEWITEAKSEETRKRRLDQAVEWMSEGKPRNWKYMKK